MIDLTEMAEAVDNALKERSPCIVATAAADGMPDMAFKGSVMVFDPDHLAFWERSAGQTLANLEANPRVCLLYRNSERGVNWRFFGEATLVRDGADREHVYERTVEPERNRDPEKNGIAVLVRVDRVIAGRQEIQTRDA